MSQILITKANGEKEFFNPVKLERSLIKAGATLENVSEIVSEIEKEIADGMSTSSIYARAFLLLRKREHHTAIRYSLRRAIMELGPSGFPFEKYIAEIFRAEGFNVETDRIIRGSCVEHEVDIVAYKNNKLIIAEAKFHNNIGIKTDLKVALYVKARFDDLLNTEIEYVGGKRRFDEGWLVTNTKFTSSAIAYGKCQRLKMVGWSYPEKEGFQNMIEKSGLHPLTCLTTLSTREKSELLNRGVVLCKTIIQKPEVLSSVGIKNNQVKNIIQEIEMLALPGV